MWLPRDERRLLAGLSHLLQGTGRRKGYVHWEYVKMLEWPWGWRRVKAYGEPGWNEDDGPSMENPAFSKECKRLISKDERAQRALKSMDERQLITLTPHASERDVLLVEMKIDGYDLGRRYGSVLGWIGLWVREYWWIWGLITFLLGTLTGEVARVIGALFHT